MAIDPEETPTLATMEELQQHLDSGGGPMKIAPELASELAAPENRHPMVGEAILHGERLGSLHRLRKLFDAHAEVAPDAAAYWQGYLLDAAQMLAMEAHYLRGIPWDDAWRTQVDHIARQPEEHRGTAIAEMLALHEEHSGEIFARLMAQWTSH